jgi:hypothetical protein
MVKIHPCWRMGGIAVACKCDVSPSILSKGLHGGGVQECYKSINFRVWVAWRSRARRLKVHLFWRMGCTVVVFKNGISASILAYALRGVRVKECYKSINFVVCVAWQSREREWYKSIRFVARVACWSRAGML